MTLLDPSLIPARANGQTIDQTWFNILKTFLINFFNEITAIQTGANRKMTISGNIAQIGISTANLKGVVEWTVEQPFTLDAVTLIGGAINSGTGLLEIEITKDGTTVFITKPVIDVTEGDYERSDSGNGASVDAQIDTVVELFAKGDRVRMDITVAPTVATADLGMREFQAIMGITPGA